MGRDVLLASRLSAVSRGFHSFLEEIRVQIIMNINGKSCILSSSTCRVDYTEQAVTEEGSNTGSGAMRAVLAEGVSTA